MKRADLSFLARLILDSSAVLVAHYRLIFMLLKHARSHTDCYIGYLGNLLACDMTLVSCRTNLKCRESAQEVLSISDIQTFQVRLFFLSVLLP